VQPHFSVVGAEERDGFGRLPLAVRWIERNLDTSSGKGKK